MLQRRTFCRVLYLSTIVLSLASAALVAAASGTTSVSSNGGGGARWGFLVAIALAVIAFIVGGIFIVVRSRREYLAIEARKASQRPDEEG